MCERLVRLEETTQNRQDMSIGADLIQDFYWTVDEHLAGVVVVQVSEPPEAGSLPHKPVSHSSGTD